MEQKRMEVLRYVKAEDPAGNLNLEARLPPSMAYQNLMLVLELELIYACLFDFLTGKHVEYLKGCFRKDQCRRLEVRNHIEAEVDQQILDVALRGSNVTARELLTNQPNGCPELVFPQGFQIECLHGQHRIQAAREFLLPTDKWWTVDFYTSDINEDLKTCLNEQHSNEDRPTDGEAYYKIRYYHFQRDTKAELRWKACLRGCRLKNLKGLLLDEKFTAGFDALLDIPGVWDGMRLTTLQKVMAMGCRDVSTPSSFMALGKDALGRIDTATVKALEGRAPGASTKDLSELRGGKIFSAFSDRERDVIWERLKMIDGLVPSLFTFFRDIQYLKLCIDCLKRLVIVPKRESVCETLARTYSDENQREGQVKIQITEDSFLDRAGTPAECADLGARQLIALAMRDYPAMPADRVKENHVQTAPTKEADPAVLRSLADLAFALGFDTPQIRALKEYPSLRTTRLDSSPSPPLHVKWKDCRTVGFEKRVETLRSDPPQARLPPQLRAEFFLGVILAELLIDLAIRGFLFVGIFLDEP
ncbi:hypothetical protein BKA65DRAFT_555502 [Rhexocercosporidium sp. MPI-PUGE-AT-0058]|nr:hypothetical protein BKA65DRAFT_555502 [Rhexocercosporidium sp. MPI-PUGE-AT-0058]